MPLSSFSQASSTAVDGGPQSTAAITAAPTPSTVNVLRLVFNIDIFLLALFACFVLLSLPRAFARFSRAIEWSRGYILRSVRLNNRRDQHLPMGPFKPSPAGKGKGKETDDALSIYSHTHLMQREDGIESHDFPPHIPAISSVLSPFVSPLQHRIVPGFSAGQAIILAGYSFVLLYAVLYKSSVFTDPVRTGFVAMAQIPFVFAFATKNNFLGMLVGLGYEKIHYVHRFTGQAITILSNIHAIGYVYQWTASGIFLSQLKQHDVAWGFVALASLNVMILTSTNFIRQKSYRLFFSMHAVGFAVFLPAVCFHKTVIIPYVFVAVIIYGADHLMRLLKSRVCKARIRPVPELASTRIEVPHINAGWRAGQHVRLRVFSSGMGWWGWMENHPFTIASTSNSPDGLVLMCKKSGSWTGKLYELAKTSGYGESGKGMDGDVKVVIEGPYGGPGHTVYASYSAAVFICGGSGISFGLSAVQELLQRDLEGTSRVKVVELIWSVQDPASFVPLVPLFRSIIHQGSLTSITISIFYTRATPGVVRITKDYLLPGLSLAPGRPKITKVLDSVIARAVSLGSGAKDSAALSGVIVGVCGPVGLGDEVSKAIGQVDSRRRKAVGGVELHEEVFGW